MAGAGRYTKLAGRNTKFTGNASASAETSHHTGTNCSFASWIANKERGVMGRCKSVDKVLCRGDDDCAHRLGWKGVGWTRQLLLCKMHEKDACGKKAMR